MPTYEYACKSCGHHLEVSQSFKDAPLTTCPVCGGELRKVFNSIGIILKGSGFYRTDSRMPAKSDNTGKGEKAEKAETAGMAGAGSGSGDKAESKTETKSETKAKTTESASSSTTKTA